MTSKKNAQTNHLQKSEIPKASGILQRTGVRSVSDTAVQSTENKEAQPSNNSIFSFDFSQVPISTNKLQRNINYPDVPEIEEDPRVRINIMIKQFNESLKGRHEKIDLGLYHEIQTAIKLVGEFKIVHGRQISRGLTEEEKKSGLMGHSQMITTPTDDGGYRELDFAFEEDGGTTIVEAKNTRRVDTHQVEKNKNLARQLGGKVIYALAGDKKAQIEAITKAYSRGEDLETVARELTFLTIPADDFGRLYQEGWVSGLEYIPTLKQIMDESFNPDEGSEYDVPVSTNKPQQIMPKLMIGPVGDKYEQEADRLAAKVVQRINAPASVQSGEDDSVQREEMETKENEVRLMRVPVLQRISSEAGMAASPDLEASINQARGSGQPLADNIRQPMEQAFGADFSGVKVHTDGQSDQLNRSIQARAFTMGQDVFFRQGEYKPGSRGGQELLAHELTHVVQQRASQCMQKKNNVKVEPHSLNGQEKVEEATSVAEMQNQHPRVQRCEGIEQTDGSWHTVSSFNNNIRLDQGGGALTVFLLGTGKFYHRVVVLEWYDGYEGKGKELVVHLTTPDLENLGPYWTAIYQLGSAINLNSMDTRVAQMDWRPECTSKPHNTVEINEERKEQVRINIMNQIGRSAGNYNLATNSCKDWAASVAPEAVI